MQYGWKYKQFKTRELMDARIEKNKHRVQWVEIFVNNVAGAIEYRKLRRVY